MRITISFKRRCVNLSRYKFESECHSDRATRLAACSLEKSWITKLNPPQNVRSSKFVHLHMKIVQSSSCNWDHMKPYVVLVRLDNSRFQRLRVPGELPRKSCGIAVAIDLKFHRSSRSGTA